MNAMLQEQLVAIAKGARRMGAEFPGSLSHNEAVIAALVLNRPDYLKVLGHTMAEAIHYVPFVVLHALVEVQHQLQLEAPLAEA